MAQYSENDKGRELDRLKKGKHQIFEPRASNGRGQVSQKMKDPREKVIFCHSLLFSTRVTKSLSENFLAQKIFLVMSHYFHLGVRTVPLYKHHRIVLQIIPKANRNRKTNCPMAKGTNRDFRYDCVPRKILRSTCGILEYPV